MNRPNILDIHTFYITGYCLWAYEVCMYGRTYVHIWAYALGVFLHGLFGMHQLSAYLQFKSVWV